MVRFNTVYSIEGPHRIPRPRPRPPRPRHLKVLPRALRLLRIAGPYGKMHRHRRHAGCLQAGTRARCRRAVDLAMVATMAASSNSSSSTNTVRLNMTIWTTVSGRHDAAP